jgi:ferredoxin-NADP reductase
MDDPQMAAKLVAHHRPGFYFRVLQEGEVGSEDEIVKIADGPERMTIAEIDAMLYLGRRTREQLDRALRIPALSDGWKSSFKAIRREETSVAVGTGDAELAPSSIAPPAWPGFRPLRVSRIERESQTVISLVLVSEDGGPLAAALPGQFVVLRMQPKADGPPLLRNYSLSDLPATDHYRVSVKQELNGLASTYLHKQVRPGDLLDVAAPRGSFTLKSGNTPVVLLSAGVGATPVLSMLHALAQESSPREVWWLFGARNREDHPFAEESKNLVRSLVRGKSCIRYSRARAQDRRGIDFDEAGHIAADMIEKLGVPRDADFYVCGPAGFMRDLTVGLTALGIPDERVRAEVFGADKPITPGVRDIRHVRPHSPEGPAGPGPRVSFARSGLDIRWDPKFPSLLEFAEACDVPVRWACRTGVCHTCESGLISGSVTYQPEPLAPASPGNVLICCSQPQGEVVLDL